MALPELVTERALISAVDPNEAFLTKIPCLLVPEPVTVFETFTSIVPVEVFSAYMPCPD